jgi:hypothetical protein
MRPWQCQPISPRPSAALPVSCPVPPLGPRGDHHATPHQRACTSAHARCSPRWYAPRPWRLSAVPDDALNADTSPSKRGRLPRRHGISPVVCIDRSKIGCLWLLGQNVYLRYPGPLRGLCTKSQGRPAGACCRSPYLPSSYPKFAPKMPAACQVCHPRRAYIASVVKKSRWRRVQRAFAVGGETRAPSCRPQRRARVKRRGLLASMGMALQRRGLRSTLYPLSPRMHSNI